ncbi:hypothetical protein [Halomicrobium salinisoli]|uniref:hypothetical protein n=1 Tax=Halomicrobium salinisoli TaxID=2878391 RepID=UPI001CF04C64|nr:hypothetical protein [Halomicrobium salinisoli]
MTPLQRTRVRWSLVAGAAMAAAAALFGLLIPGVVPPVLAAAAFLTGTAVWWMVAPSDGGTVRRGLLAGGLAGLVTHVAYWTLLLLSYGRPFVIWGHRSSDVLQIAAYSAVGIALLGVLTVPLGAAVGGLVAAAQSRYGSPDSDDDADTAGS